MRSSEFLKSPDDQDNHNHKVHTSLVGSELPSALDLGLNPQNSKPVQNANNDQSENPAFQVGDDRRNNAMTCTHCENLDKKQTILSSFLEILFDPIATFIFGAIAGSYLTGSAIVDALKAAGM